MWWLSFVGPLVAVLVYVLTGRPDGRRERQVEGWRKAAANPRRVTSLPGPLARVLEYTGGGEPVAYFELATKLAYLAVMSADATQGSDQVTVIAKLDDSGPSFTARPLPIEEGVRVPNTGVEFKKDPELMANFLVEGTLGDRAPAPVTDAEAKRIRQWLSPPLREALLDFPDGWLRVDGKVKAMAFTAYGPPDAQRIEALVAAADIVFAEHGAGGGPSLLPGDDAAESAPAAPPPEQKRRRGGAAASPAQGG
jgi:hypothetical protein